MTSPQNMEPARLLVNQAVNKLVARNLAARKAAERKQTHNPKAA